MPHKESLFNKLEIFNEISMVLIAFIMIGILMKLGSQDTYSQNFVVFSFFVIGGTIAVVNLCVILNIVVKKLIRKWKARKAKK